MLLQSQDLFRAGERGFLSGRVPALCHAGDGVLLAAWEARRADANGQAGDWADIDIVARRSEDGGATWSPLVTLADGGILPAHNANLIADAEGALHFVFFVNYAHAFHAVSRDRGRTFSAPREITEVFRGFHADYLWNAIAGGPGHGVVTRRGRIILPVWLSNGGRHHRPSVVASIYSDDCGRTWRRGDIVPPRLPNMSETAGVELEDGSILFNIRSEDRAHRRATSRSPDGAANWSPPVFDKALKEPVCMGNLLRLNFADPATGSPGRVLFCNPDNDVYTGRHGPSWNGNKDRVNLTLRLSFDDCATWPVSRVIDPGIAGYCDLAHDGDDTLHILYEKGGVNDSMWTTRSIALASLSVSSLLGERPASAAASLDAARPVLA